MGISDQEGLLKRSEISDSFVLDIENLTHVADKDATLNPKRTRSLSRKGSQGGAERKSTGRETTDASSKGDQGGVYPDEKSVDLQLVGTTTIDSTTATTIGESRCRRYIRCSSSVSRRSSWIDPRRVLLLFATLSCMGTMVVIYFTLSIANINEDGAQMQ